MNASDATPRPAPPPQAAPGPPSPGTGPTAADAPALEMRGITKRYPGVVANDHIDLDVRHGEIHALLGENGAGKTTLMNVLYGLAQPDEGQILLDGQPVRIASPADAIRRGISMVHQHFMLVPVFSVAENIVLGEETMANPVFLDLPEAERRIRALSEGFGFDLDPEAKVGQLSVGQQQRVEILKALYRDARLLVLDEPTAVLTPQETEEIFVLLKRLAAGGHSIIFISHKLYEVLEIADRITVIRRGKVVGHRVPAETDEDDLAELMVGREVQLTVDRGTSHPGEPTLEVRGLRVKDDRGSEVVRGVDFEIRAGEILGLAGVAGNGQDEMVEALVGLRSPTAGTVTLGGRDITRHNVRSINEAGVGYVPADRHRFGLVLPFPVSDNLVLTDYYRRPYARGIVQDEAAIDHACEVCIEDYDIRTPSADVPTRTLSGGNQQKVVVAREFRRDLQLLVLDQPTRGLDVGSIEFIHKQVIAKRDAGTAVLLVSAELDEILEMSDRIAVMYRGQLVAVLDGRTADKNQVGLLMATGGHAAGPAASSGAVA
ncbi:MAG TPA: ABC transporter ATP-binding protein [Candidatus Limnocylindrales bacterium]|nr:ABC transporter ATP-binding protein [Candidatus Limnocylindrales bacterium]